jgi:hypothetical protein
VVWGKLHTKLARMHQGRWNGEQGHIGAEIAILLGLGWGPNSPMLCKDDLGMAGG